MNRASHIQYRTSTYHNRADPPSPLPQLGNPSYASPHHEITIVSSRYASLNTPSHRRASISYPQHFPHTREKDRYPARPPTSPTIYQPEPRHILPASRPRFLSSPSVASESRVPSDILVLPAAPEAGPIARPSIASDIVVLPPTTNQPSSAPIQRPNLQHIAPSADHLFVTLDGDNTLRMSNTASLSNLRRVRDSLLPLWPGGVECDREHRGELEISFGGNVWNAGGNESVAARRLLAQLFSSLAGEGYSFLCVVQKSQPPNPPRMLFTSTKPQKTRFFALSFSANNSKITIVDGPSAVVNAIASSLQGTASKVNEKTNNRGQLMEQRTLHVINIAHSPTVQGNLLTKFIKDTTVDLLPICSQLLRAVSPLGFTFVFVHSFPPQELTKAYRLEASIPMGRKGLLNRKGVREVWLFKAVGTAR